MYLASRKKMFMNSISNYPLALFILQLFLSGKVFCSLLSSCCCWMLRVLELSEELYLIVAKWCDCAFCSCTWRLRFGLHCEVYECALVCLLVCAYRCSLGWTKNVQPLNFVLTTTTTCTFKSHGCLRSFSLIFEPHFQEVNDYFVPFSGQVFIRNKFVFELPTPTFNS